MGPQLTVTQVFHHFLKYNTMERSSSRRDVILLCSDLYSLLPERNGGNSYIFRSLLGSQTLLVKMAQKNPKTFAIIITCLGLTYIYCTMTLKIFSEESLIVAFMMQITLFFLFLCFIDKFTFFNVTTQFDFWFLVVQVGACNSLSVWANQVIREQPISRIILYSAVQSMNTLILSLVFAGCDCFINFPRLGLIIGWIGLVIFWIGCRVSLEFNDSDIIQTQVCIIYYDCTLPSTIIKNLQSSIAFVCFRYLISTILYKDSMIIVKCPVFALLPKKGIHPHNIQQNNNTILVGQMLFHIPMQRKIFQSPHQEAFVRNLNNQIQHPELITSQTHNIKSITLPNSTSVMVHPPPVTRMNINNNNDIYVTLTTYFTSKVHTCRYIIPEESYLSQFFYKRTWFYYCIFIFLCLLSDIILPILSSTGRNNKTWTMLIYNIMTITNILFVLVLLMKCELMLFLRTCRTYNYWYVLFMVITYYVMGVLFRHDLVAYSIYEVLTETFVIITSILNMGLQIGFPDCSPTTHSKLPLFVSVCTAAYWFIERVINSSLNQSDLFQTEHICLGYYYTCTSPSSIIINLNGCIIVFVTAMMIFKIRYPQQLKYIGARLRITAQ